MREVLNTPWLSLSESQLLAKWPVSFASLAIIMFHPLYFGNSQAIRQLVLLNFQVIIYGLEILRQISND